MVVYMKHHPFVPLPWILILISHSCVGGSRCCCGLSSFRCLHLTHSNPVGHSRCSGPLRSPQWHSAPPFTWLSFCLAISIILYRQNSGKAKSIPCKNTMPFSEVSFSTAGPGRGLPSKNSYGKHKKKKSVKRVDFWIDVPASHSNTSAFAGTKDGDGH